jgi:membrane-bound serine protease (ClpP class)
VFLFVAIVLLLLLDSPWNVIACIVSLGLFVGELAFWNGRVRHRSPAAGAETMIGKTAVVVSECRPNGQIRLGGELWEARCNEGADAGETVRVTALEDLTLIVERAAPG